jgi:hypothetical protein
MFLSSLNDRELLARLVSLCRHEREVTLEVLRHLNEVERRKLYLRLGYSSMFAYCTQALRYSESAAGRRIAAARCLRRVPRVEALLARREVSLMSLGLIERVLTPENASELLGRIRGKSKLEVERVVAEYRPEVVVRDRVRAIQVPGPAARRANATTPATTPVTATTSVPFPPPRLLVNEIANSHGGSEKVPDVPARTIAMFQLNFAVTPEFMVMYREVCALLSNKIAMPTFATVFQALMEDYQKRRCPRARHARRDERKARKAASSAVSVHMDARMG